MKIIYLIRAYDGKYKIGITKNIYKRVQQLQTGNPEILTIQSQYQSEMASKIESVLHRMYRHKKIKGEWFLMDIDDEVNFIDNCRKIEENLTILKQSENPYLS